jgi:hypothetical protein
VLSGSMSLTGLFVVGSKFPWLHGAIVLLRTYSRAFVLHSWACNMSLHPFSQV